MWISRLRTSKLSLIALYNILLYFYICQLQHFKHDDIKYDKNIIKPLTYVATGTYV